MESKTNEEIIKVTCAIIEHEGKILSAQRSKKMSMPLKWEFPGGKVEHGERFEDSIKRELREELDINIEIITPLKSHIHNYGKKTIELIPFVCIIESGNIKCKEHKSIVWDKPERLKGIDWADADIPIYNEYVKYLAQKSNR